MYQTKIGIAIIIIGFIITWTMIYFEAKRVDDLMCGKSKKVSNAERYYNLLKSYYPQADALYKENIIDVVGRQGLYDLTKAKLIEEYDSPTAGNKLYFL